MTRTRTSVDDLAALALDDLAVALIEAGCTVGRRRKTAINVSFDDNRMDLDIIATAYATEARAAELIDDRAVGDARPVLVADRITADARERLSEAGWGWLDRRGHLRLRAPGVLIDSNVSPVERAQQNSADPIRGLAGLSIAYRLLTNPKEPISPTRSTMAFAPSTISVALSRLRNAGLVDANAAPVIPELFWALAEEWSPERTWLITEPNVNEAVWHDPESPGWCISGTVAAAEFGAPVVSTTSIPDLYVPGPVVLTIATRRYGLARDANVAAASIAVAPVSDVTTHRRSPVDQPWPLAHPVAVALDLAQDRSRGREILDEWSPTERVW